jgi:hypothetical protein
MCLDAAVIGPGVGDDERSGDRRGIEAELRGDPGPEPPFPIERADGLANVDDLGLDLDEEQRPGRRMPGRDVDEATLAREIERHLGPRDPALATKRPEQRLHKRRVTGARQPLDLAGSGPEPEIEASFEHPCDTANHGDAQGGTLATLDARDGLVGDPGEPSNVDLSQAAADSQDANQGTDPLVVHDDSLRRAAARLLIRTRVRYRGQPWDPRWISAKGEWRIPERLCTRSPRAWTNGPRAWAERGGAISGCPQDVAIGRDDRPLDVVVLS